jgi:uroporphyrinogen decarboxylase
MFEEKVIEKRENSQVVQDWKGNICEIGLEFDVTYLRTAHDFCTRRWIKCPVESKADWLEMRKRYDANDPTRFLPENEMNKQAEILKDRNWFSGLNFSGPYWILREWCGFEGLCMMFYDNPALVEEMIDFWRVYVGDLIKKALQYYTPDQIHISEDMAYKGHSMLSPEMTRKFLLPCWKYWGEIIHEAVIPLYAVDSDGAIDELIPIWIEAGVNACDPIEVAAGNDIVEFRKRFGKNMAYRGGVDKREMARGGQRLEAEIERIMPVIKDGGFIPSCDHGVPSDVSWPNFVYYTKLLAQATGWL